ncbi:MAG: hypothetical protein JW870_08065 [Candidatus Delongbacteria bacterium]|nr:hypothetical protein [Candidatus Delongbacteria bacterium]
MQLIKKITINVNMNKNYAFNYDIDARMIIQNFSLKISLTQTKNHLSRPKS